MGVLLHILSGTLIGLCCAYLCYWLEMSWLLIFASYSIGGGLGLCASAGLAYFLKRWTRQSRS